MSWVGRLVLPRDRLKYNSRDCLELLCPKPDFGDVSSCLGVLLKMPDLVDRYFQTLNYIR